MLSTEEIRTLLANVRSGDVPVETALAQLTRPRMEDPRTVSTGATSVDVHRARRCGFPEVVFAEGKAADEVVNIFRILSERGQDCLATRVSADQALRIVEEFPGAEHNSIARTVRLDITERPRIGRVVVVTAGTSDRPVAEEALETLKWIRCETDLLVDVGVAGPHRLPEQLHRLECASAVVVVAGMEGALPSIVGGWVDCPVIAVPTSVGYGASLGGIAALLGMLNSCASNVSVVNIDAGFKAAYVAGLIARRGASQ
jgi:pyridinium-3,5-biscarboxylic acid mononucleotide synthase